MLATVVAKLCRVRGRGIAMKDRRNRCTHGHRLEMRPRPDIGEGWVEGWASKKCQTCPKDEPISIPRCEVYTKENPRPDGKVEKPEDTGGSWL